MPTAHWQQARSPKFEFEWYQEEFQSIDEKSNIIVQKRLFGFDFLFFPSSFKVFNTIENMFLQKNQFVE